MHFLKYFTVCGLCAIMLGTQPSIVHMANVYAKETDTYGSDTQIDSKKERSEEEDTQNHSEENSNVKNKDKTDDSSEDFSSESNFENEESSEETTENSAGSENNNPSQNTEDLENTESTEKTENTEASSTDTGDQKPSTDTSTSTEEDSVEGTTEKTPAVTSSTVEHKSTVSSKNEKGSTETAAKSSAAPDKKSGTSKKKKEAVKEKKELKELDGSIISEEESIEKDTDPEAVIPKIYGTSQITTRDDAEYMGDFVYFNQTDSIWNQNGYRIASAGCGPTSMAVVISSLTKKWITPVDATVWAYEHGYYSSAGSAHTLIPAMAEAYGLKCKGVGTDYESIRTALKKGRPVIALMGPGYFTRRGHFMVLIDIDDEDNVTVADVGSRTRSAYKYALSDIIRQSKSASAGGPFWVISKPKRKKKKNVYTSPQNDYVIHTHDNGKDKTITFHLGDRVSYNGTEGVILQFENRKAYVTGTDGQTIMSADGDKTIRLTDLRIIKRAPETIYGAVISRMEDLVRRNS